MTSVINRDQIMVNAAIDANNRDGYSQGDYETTNGFLFGMGGETIYQAAVEFSLNIPQGKTIVSAYLYFREGYVDGWTTDDIVNVEVYDVGNAPVFVEGHAHNMRSHAALGSQVIEWDNIGGGPIGKLIKSPDLKSLIQIPINRSDWAENNYVGLVLSAKTPTVYHMMYMYNTESDEPQNVPRLTVVYQDRRSLTPVAVSDTSIQYNYGTGLNHIEWEHTIVGRNRALLVCLCNGDEEATGVTANGVSLTEISTEQFPSGWKLSQWLLMNPPIGVVAISASFDTPAGGAVLRGSGVSLVGVNQTGGSYTYRTPQLATAVSNTPTLVMSSSYGEMCVGAYHIVNTNNYYPTGTNDTVVQEKGCIIGPNGEAWVTVSGYATTGSTRTLSTSDDDEFGIGWYFMGTSFKPAMVVG